MRHQTTTIVRVVPRPADPETGSLDGFAVVCEHCGTVCASTIKSQAHRDAADHVRVMRELGK